MSVKVTLNCLVKDHHFGDLQKFLEDNLANVRNFPGCQSVELYFDHANSELLIDEIWQDTSSHQSYISAITESGVFAEFGSFFKAPPAVKYFHRLDI